MNAAPTVAKPNNCEIVSKQLWKTTHLRLKAFVGIAVTVEFVAEARASVTVAELVA